MALERKWEEENGRRILREGLEKITIWKITK